MLEFDERNHQYTLNGKQLLSVSYFLTQFKPSFNPEDAAKKYAIKNNQNIECVLSEWENKKNLGKALHKVLELYHQGLTIENKHFKFIADNTATKQEQIKKIFQAGTSFLKRIEEKFKTYKNEYQVYATAKELLDYLKINNVPCSLANKNFYGIAGTIDNLFQDKNDKSSFILTDYKVTNLLTRKSYENCRFPIDDLKGDKITQYELNVTLYKILCKIRGIPIKDAFLINIIRDSNSGQYKIIRCVNRKKEIIKILSYFIEKEH